MGLRIDSSLDFQLEGTPATPPSGWLSVYAKSNSGLYLKNSGGQENEVPKVTYGTASLVIPAFQTAATPEVVTHNGGSGLSGVHLTLASAGLYVVLEYDTLNATTFTMRGYAASGNGGAGGVTVSVFWMTVA